MGVETIIRIKLNVGCDLKLHETSSFRELTYSVLKENAIYVLSVYTPSIRFFWFFLLEERQLTI